MAATTRKTPSIDGGMATTASRQYDTVCPQLLMVLTPWFIDDAGVKTRQLMAIENESPSAAAARR